MSTKLKKEINGVKFDYDTLKAQMIANGLNADTKFNDRTPANLPASGEFIGFEPAEVGTRLAHYRMIAKDAKGKEYRISIGRLGSYGLEKKKDDQQLNLDDIAKSTKGNFYIRGESINPEISTDHAKAALELVGTKFRAKKIVLFSLPFQDEDTPEDERILSKEDALKRVGVSTAFKITLD